MHKKTRFCSIENHINNKLQRRGGENNVDGKSCGRISMAWLRCSYGRRRCSGEFNVFFYKPDDWQQNYSQNKTIKNWFDSFDTSQPLPLTNFVFTPERVAEMLDGRDGSIDLIPSHLGLINVDLELATKLSGVNLKQAKRNFLGVHNMLSSGVTTRTV